MRLLYCPQCNGSNRYCFIDKTLYCSTCGWWKSVATKGTQTSPQQQQVHMQDMESEEWDDSGVPLVDDVSLESK
jgi:hypothetical protein